MKRAEGADGRKKIKIYGEQEIMYSNELNGQSGNVLGKNAEKL